MRSQVIKIKIIKGDISLTGTRISEESNMNKQEFNKANLMFSQEKNSTR